MTLRSYQRNSYGKVEAFDAVRRLLEDPEPDLDLTPRERQMVRLAVAGLSTGEIAEELGLALATVKTHFQNVTKKTGVPKSDFVSRFYARLRAIIAEIEE